MRNRKLAQRLMAGLAGAALCAMAVGTALAQSPNDPHVSASSVFPSTGPIVAVETPFSGSGVAGNVTFYGFAVDCANGEAAQRVAVYDGTDENAPYLADVAMGTTMDLGQSCIGQGGPAPVGFTLILDSRLLEEGHHSLTFVAEYPSGEMAAVGADLVIDNVPQYQSIEND